MLKGPGSNALVAALILGVSFYIPAGHTGLIGDIVETTGAEELTQPISDTTGLDSTSTLESLDPTPDSTSSESGGDLTSLEGLDTTTLQSLAATVAVSTESNLEPVVETTGPVLETTTDTTSPLTDTVSDSTSPLTDEILSVTEPLVETIDETTSPLTDIISETTDPVLEPLVEETQPIVDTVVDTTEPVIDAVVEVTEPIVDTVTEVVSPITETVTEPLDPVLEDIVEVTAPLTDTIVDAAAPVTEPLEPITDRLLSSQQEILLKPVPNNNPGIWPLMFTSQLSAKDAGESAMQVAANCKDSDLDGVCDIQDECPNTPLGKTVMAQGCHLQGGQSLQLAGVYFAFDSAILTTDSMAFLNKAVEIILESDAQKVEVGGHADSIGTEPYNERLSRARAGAVFTYLVSKGVDPERLVVNGYGEAKPAVANNTEQNRAMNRRVEFNILNDVSELQTAQLE